MKKTFLEKIKLLKNAKLADGELKGKLDQLKEKIKEQHQEATKELKKTILVGKLGWDKNTSAVRRTIEELKGDLKEESISWKDYVLKNNVSFSAYQPIASLSLAKSKARLIAAERDLAALKRENESLQSQVDLQGALLSKRATEELEPHLEKLFLLLKESKVQRDAIRSQLREEERRSAEHKEEVASAQEKLRAAELSLAHVSTQTHQLERFLEVCLVDIQTTVKSKDEQITALERQVARLQLDLQRPPEQE